MYHPRLAPYSSHPKRNDLSTTALTPPPIRTTYHYYLPTRHAARNDHPVYSSHLPHQTVQTAKKSQCF